MSNQFDRHPFDDPNAHNAQLKVGGLETPSEACAERDAEIARLKEALRVYEERNSIEINLVADALAKRDLEIALLKADRSALLDGSNVTKLQEQNAALRALLERVPHREWSEYEKHSINGDDAIQFSSDCPKCAYEIAKLAKLTHEKATAKEA